MRFLVQIAALAAIVIGALALGAQDVINPYAMIIIIGFGVLLSDIGGSLSDKSK